MAEPVLDRVDTGHRNMFCSSRIEDLIQTKQLCTVVYRLRYQGASGKAEAAPIAGQPNRATNVTATRERLD
jgi:hypothetical protein